MAREVHLGPPGYGENPKTDERDTIFVLVLTDSIRVCPDPNVSRDMQAASVTKIQLLRPPVAVQQGVGAEVSVFGMLERAVLGAHFLPVLMRVDSISGLQQPLGRRATSGTG